MYPFLSIAEFNEGYKMLAKRSIEIQYFFVPMFFPIPSLQVCLLDNMRFSSAGYWCIMQVSFTFSLTLHC